MNSLVNFILESGVSLALLSLIYILFLRKETFFRLNRIFLLFSVAFSIVLPFLKFHVYEPQSVMLAEVTVTPYRNLMEAVTIYGKDLSGTVVQTISSSRFVMFIYLFGVSFFLIRFLIRLTQIMVLIYKHPVNQLGGIKFVSVTKKISPFSFMGYVFINPEKRGEQGYEKIVAHEIEHIKQGHTFDVLILEVMSVFQWFNPFMWILKRVIRENHEYLADRAVLGSGISVAQYKQLLLSQTLGVKIDMANNFNSSLVKKRIKMISRIQSSKLANLKYVFGILSLVALVIVFACEQKELIGSEDHVQSTANERLITISLLDDKLKIDGSKEDLEYLHKLIIKKNDYNLEVDSLGHKYLIKKQEPYFRTLNDNEQIFFVVEKMPVFPGGDTALRKYIANSISYPRLAIEKEVQGKVYVSFVVTAEGEIANTRIARGVDPLIDKEALRVVNSLPKWKPGFQRGKAVNVNYTVPINFTLQ